MLIDLTSIQRDVINDPVVNPVVLSDFKIPPQFKNTLKDLLNEKGYDFNDYTSYAVTDKATDKKAANFAIIPNQYFVFAFQMHDLAVEVFKYVCLFNKVRQFAGLLVGNAGEIKAAIENNPSLSAFFDSPEDINLFSKFLDKDNSLYRLDSKRLINDSGEPRGAKDCFGSAILKRINLPDASSSVFGSLVYDLVQMPTLFKELKDYWQNKETQSRVETAVSETIKVPKPFILLAGISGTGKTRFIRKQAEAHNVGDANFCLVPVRPDWQEPSELLGYETRLTKSGDSEYVATDVLRFIGAAWREILDSGMQFEAFGLIGDEGITHGVVGYYSDLSRVKPYWLCLDEMNLAPVEQYFADYLSVLETRLWQWHDDEFTYSSDALLSSSKLYLGGEKLRNEMGFAEQKYDGFWSSIINYGLPLPFSLIVAGTVNMDETTHGFSRKVIDRALSFDFGAFFPNDYDDFFTPTSCNKRLSYPIWSRASKTDLVNTFDADGAKTVAFLSAVNAVLKNTPFELAFRALNELLLAVASSQAKDDLTLKAVWDDFMMCKVLPRIEGDADKLTTSDGKALLAELNTVLAAQLAPVWLTSETDKTNQRPDLYREKVVADGATDQEKVLHIPCRSKAKLKWMSDRLASATFTSFWP